MFPDAVAVMVALFNGVDGFKAFSEYPPEHDHSEPSIRVEDVGGPGVTDHVMDAQRVTFFVEHADRRVARAMGEKVRETLHNHPGGVWYWVADTSNVYYRPDPGASQHQYVYTARINTKKV